MPTPAFDKRQFFVLRCRRAGYDSLQADDWYAGLARADRRRSNQELFERFTAARAFAQAQGA
jgi:hypothetical protein